MRGLGTGQLSSHESWRKSGRRQKLRRGLVAALLGMSMLTTGCTALSNVQKNLQYDDSWSEWVISHRNTAWSARAWHLRKHHFCNEKHLDDFCAGFRAGYEDVAAGSNGCTPSFPPQRYWGWKYQSADGQARVASWFSGYPHGARAAEEDGVGHFSQIQMSSTIYNEYHNVNQAMPASQIYPMPEVIPNYGPIPTDGAAPVGQLPIMENAPANPVAPPVGVGVPGVPPQG